MPKPATALAKRIDSEGAPRRARDGMRHQLAALAVGRLVAHGDVQQLVARRARRRGTLIAQRARLVQRDVERRVGAHDLVQRGDHVARADVARVLRVVREVLVAQQAVLVAEEAIGAHARRD